MSWRPHGRAYSTKSAWAICDRCGLQVMHSDLNWQFDWTGPRLQNLRILVCRRCLDVPFEHNRPIITPPDPVPLMNPRPDTYEALNYNTSNLLDQNLEVITDTNGANIIATPNGTLNVPPYPFAGFTMLRATDGGPVQQVVVRDDAYAVQATLQNDVQVKDTMGNPVFSTTPSTNPNTGYNNLNRFNNPPGQVGSQYAFPVILEIE
jgi:hypothetical protein